MPESARASFVAEPRLPEDIAAADLDAEVRRDLRGLQKDTADSVARHLVAAGSLVDDDPELALEHARYARRRASRIAVVREAAGIAAYHAGEWAEALSELRAARRMGGGPLHVPVMADIERALGRPERAIDLARGPEARELDAAGRIELTIVAAGARRDLGEQDAAVVALQVPELDPARRDPWSARLFYAYADNLLAAGREADAVQWFTHAAEADRSEETDAVRRLAEITGDDLDDADAIAFSEDDTPSPTVDDESQDDAISSEDGSPIAVDVRPGPAPDGDAAAAATGDEAGAGDAPHEDDVAGVVAGAAPEPVDASGDGLPAVVPGDVAGRDVGGGRQDAAPDSATGEGGALESAVDPAEVPDPLDAPDPPDAGDAPDAGHEFDAATVAEVATGPEMATGPEVATADEVATAAGKSTPPAGTAGAGSAASGGASAPAGADAPTGSAYEDLPGADDAVAEDRVTIEPTAGQPSDDAAVVAPPRAGDAGGDGR